MDKGTCEGAGWTWVDGECLPRGPGNEPYEKRSHPNDSSYSVVWVSAGGTTGHWTREPRSGDNDGNGAGSDTSNPSPGVVTLSPGTPAQQIAETIRSADADEAPELLIENIEKLLERVDLQSLIAALDPQTPVGIVAQVVTTLLEALRGESPDDVE